MAENNEEKKMNVNEKETKKVSEKEVKKEAKKETDKAEPKKETTKVDTENKSDTTFKKVETKNKKEKSNHGLLKAILVLIGILVIAYFIFVMRNYMILKDIIIRYKTMNGFYIKCYSPTYAFFVSV